MHTIQTKEGHTITLYNNVKQLPVNRYNEVQKYLLMDSGVGSDMEAIQSRYARLYAFLAEKKIEEAQKEAENMYYTHYSILEAINYKSYAFCCLISEINGEAISDYSEDGIRAILKKLEGIDLSQYDIESSIDIVKKKSQMN